jgi:hypothetical protein
MNLVMAIGRKEGTEDLSRNVTNNEITNALNGISLAGKAFFPFLSPHQLT